MVVVVVVLVEVVVPGDPVKVEAEDRPPGEKLLLPVPVLVALGVVCVWL